MNCKIKCTVAFVLGAAVGSVTVWKLLKTKYEQLAQEEIDSVIEVFSRREAKQSIEDVSESHDDDVVKETMDNEKQTRNMYEKMTTNYTNYSEMSGKEPEKKQETTDRPYVIEPSDFGELDDYERISLTYYDDQVLVDEDDELVEDVDNVVGFDSLNHFGEFEDDAVFVRNDRLKCDYEILLDQRRYSDVIRKKPHQTED